MNKEQIPEWAVIGAEVVSDDFGRQVIVRVSKTSVWTNASNMSDTRDTRWLPWSEDGLRLYGSDRWNRTIAYRADSRQGRKIWRDHRRTQAIKSVFRRHSEFSRKPDLETAEALRAAVTRFTLQLQKIHVEEAEEREQAQRKA